MNDYPGKYQDWLFEALHLEDGDEVQPDILEPLYQLNQHWVKSDGVMDYDGQHQLMRAYTLYYMSINIPKLWFVFDHRPQLIDQFLEGDELCVTELGCGPGTFLWAFLFYVQARKPNTLTRIKRLRGIDRCPTTLEYANRFAEVLKREKIFSHIEFSFEPGDWEAHLNCPGELLIFGNVLNEGSAEADWDGLDAGMVAMIEPGTRRSFHPLLSVRDCLLRSSWNVHFPCTNASTPCPMAEDNWCHFTVNRFQLPFIQRISNKAKRLNARHSFSAFLFSREETHCTANDWRVLSRLRKANRSGIRWLCNGKSLAEVVLGRKNRTEENRPFLDADWGDCLQITLNAPEKQFLRSGRLPKQSEIQTTD